MSKKMLLTTVFLLFVGVLVAGAVYRTQARVALVSSTSEQSHDEAVALDTTAPSAWQTLQGTVTQFDTATLTITIRDEEPLLIEGRPLSFALEQGFTVVPGDTIQVEGYDEDGEFKVGRMTDLTNGQSVQLRDAEGRPGWGGRGSEN